MQRSDASLVKFQIVFYYFRCRYIPNIIGDDQSTNGLGKYTVWDGKYEDNLLASRRFLQCKNGKNLKSPLLTTLKIIFLIRSDK